LTGETGPTHLSEYDPGTSGIKDASRSTSPDSSEE
jgi:hypothetical protein